MKPKTKSKKAVKTKSKPVNVVTTGKQKDQKEILAGAKVTFTSTKKPGKTPTRDWITLKAEFLKSEYTEVSAFLKERHGIEVKNNGAVTRQVRGWGNEKIELKKKGLQNAKEKIVSLYTPAAEELAQMHQGIITLFKASIQKELSDCIGGIDPKSGKTIIKRDPNIADMRRIWEIVKAEKLEPTAVHKTENSMADEDRQLLSALLDENFDDDDDDL